MITAVHVLESLPEGEVRRIRQYLGPDYSLDGDRAALARVLFYSGRMREALPIAEDLVRSGQDVLTYPYGTGAYVLGMVLAVRGEPATARGWFAKAHAAFRAEQMNWPLFTSIEDEILAIHLRYAPDTPDESERLLKEVEQDALLAGDPGLTIFAESVGLPFLVFHGGWGTAKDRALAVRSSPLSRIRALAAWCLAVLAQYQGQPDTATQYVNEILPAGVKTHVATPQFQFAMDWRRLAAALALDSGNTAAAREWLEAHDRESSALGVVFDQAETQTLWARYFRASGDPERARQHVERSLVLASDPRQPVVLLAAHRLLGELQTNAHHFSSAREHFDQSLALADACAAPYERALTLLAMTELYISTGQGGAAMSTLDEVRAICAPLGAQPALARVDALAARLTAATSAKPVYPNGLSVREAEVLHLLAGGSSNQDIANTLSISVRTVERHVTNLYGKIGAHGRADAIAYALRHSS
jgi:DNA-binding CsgD family transcriptional regulator/tetratricopeptide (TPR) repeat protein